MNDAITTNRLLSIPGLSRPKLAQCPRKTHKDIASGRFGPDIIRLGRCTRVREEELDAWINAGCPSRETWLAIRGGQWVTP